MKATITIDWTEFGADNDPPRIDDPILKRADDRKESLKDVHSRVRAAVRDAVNMMETGDSLRVKLDITPRKDAS